MPRQQSNDFVKLMIVAVLCLMVGYAWGGAAASSKTRVKVAPCPVVEDPNRPLPLIPVWDQHEPGIETWKVFNQEHPATDPLR